jgi:hypothetical protein
VIEEALEEELSAPVGDRDPEKEEASIAMVTSKLCSTVIDAKPCPNPTATAEDSRAREMFFSDPETFSSVVSDLTSSVAKRIFETTNPFAKTISEEIQTFSEVLPPSEKKVSHEELRKARVAAKSALREQARLDAIVRAIARELRRLERQRVVEGSVTLRAARIAAWRLQRIRNETLMRLVHTMDRVIPEPSRDWAPYYGDDNQLQDEDNGTTDQTKLALFAGAGEVVNFSSTIPQFIPCLGSYCEAGVQVTGRYNQAALSSQRLDPPKMVEELILNVDGERHAKEHQRSSDGHALRTLAPRPPPSPLVHPHLLFGHHRVREDSSASSYCRAARRLAAIRFKRSLAWA